MGGHFANEIWGRGEGGGLIGILSGSQSEYGIP